MGFDAKSYLQSQGWGGEGKPLKKGGRARPILHAQKKTLSGVGKDTYNSFPWWDALFAGVANKLATKPGTASISHKTQTGILSPLPPPTGTPPVEKASNSLSQQGALAKHADVMGQIQRDHARATLYSSFVRGPISKPTEPPPSDPEPVASTSQTPLSVSTPEEETDDGGQQKKEKKSKKPRMVINAKGQEVPETKAQRRARRAAKKEAKALKQHKKEQKKLSKKAEEPANSSKSKKRKDRSESEGQEEPSPESQVNGQNVRGEDGHDPSSKKKKKRKREDDGT